MELCDDMAKYWLKLLKLGLRSAPYNDLISLPVIKTYILSTVTDGPQQQPHGRDGVYKGSKQCI
jgi:hypothetical protein